MGLTGIKTTSFLKRLYEGSFKRKEISVQSVDGEISAETVLCSETEVN